MDTLPDRERVEAEKLKFSCSQEACMARSRRPELEKDNPAAPETYVGRRRKPEQPPSVGRADMVETLQKLTDAAEQFVNRVPRLKRNEVERQALLDAITHAQLILSVRKISSGRPAR